MNITSLLIISLLALSGSIEGRKYKRTWKDLDSRPLPEWYDKSKIGIFIHWGVYSVPAMKSEWFWRLWKDKDYSLTEFMKNNYPCYKYQNFAPMFTAEFFDADQWADIIKQSGAKYVVLTSKHHDGFGLFPSPRSYGWNSVDTGPRKDIVRELSEAVRKKHIVFGLYYSLYEWYHPLYKADKRASFTTKSYTREKMWPDIQQLVNDYKPSIIWADGDWEANENYWKSKELLAWLYNDSPVKDEIVVNDRWGKTSCKHGGFYNCKDRYNPGVLLSHKWENAFTLDKLSWGHRKNMKLSEIMATKDLFKEFVITISCGGNVLINIGPTQQGTISPIFVERLLTLGQWLETNGRAIYETSPWFHQKDGLNKNVWYTCQTKNYTKQNPVKKPASKSDVIEIFAITLIWPEDDILRLRYISGFINETTNIKIFGYNESLKATFKDKITEIYLPPIQKVSSKYAWVIQFKDNYSS